MKSVESQRPDLKKQIAAVQQQIVTAEREKKRVENLLKAGAANQKQLDDWEATDRFAYQTISCPAVFVATQYQQLD